MGAAARAIGQRVVGPPAQPLRHLTMHVPHQAVLGGALGVARDRGAVARVVQRQGIGPRQRRIARRVEGLQRLDGHRLRGDAHPRVTLPHDLLVRQRPANVQVEQVRRVQHLDHHRAAEAGAIRGSPHQHARGERRVGGSDHSRARLRPVIDAGGPREQELFLDITIPGQVGRHPGLAGAAERVRRRRHRQRAVGQEGRGLCAGRRRAPERDDQQEEVGESGGARAGGGEAGGAHRGAVYQPGRGPDGRATIGLPRPPTEGRP